MRYLALLLPFLAGCPSLTMTPEQLKASDGNDYLLSAFQHVRQGQQHHRQS